MFKRTATLVSILIVFVVGVFLGKYTVSNEERIDSENNTTQEMRKIKYWVAPMDPNYRRDEPGKSPMGMDLVPVYDEDDSELNDESTVIISPQVQNNLGVKVATVKRESFSNAINTVGYAVADENKIEHVTVYVDGWIRNLVVKTTGEAVKKEQLLFEMYSPALVQAQEEYLLALNNKNFEVMNASEQKLATLGISKEQIEQLKATKQVMNEVKIYSDQNGVVSNLNVREGMYVKPETRIMTIEDLSDIWVIAEVFERQAGFVQVGQNAIASFPYMPGKEWIGTVEYVYPELDQKTHALRVRLTFPNIDLLIKPNMYANIKIHTQPLKDVLTVPSSALIRTGEGDRVIVALGHGQYRPQAVKVGNESEGRYIVLSGVNEGDQIVTSAQFLIDSESNLKASFSRMLPESSEGSTGAVNEFRAMGIVKKVYPSEHRILLAHQEIPEISMPAMEMEMSVDKAINLGNLKDGDHIHILFIQESKDNLHIVKIQIMPRD